MNSYTDTLAYLYGLQRRGMKFGLRNINTLLASVGNPHERFPSIHIAGTNGKGSTAAFLASIATESGLKTALYTSPHLLRFTERIRINGKEISARRLVSYARRLRPSIESVRATFFEATTCIAFQYFADEEVELAVIETGLGGRLDATNVLVPLVSVITNISLEHREYLGNTIRSIAREKGGIIKPGVPCVTGSEDREALNVLKQIATAKRTTLFEARKVVSVQEEEKTGRTTVVNIRSNHQKIQNARLGLDGPHQIHNARLALASLELLLRKKGSGSVAGRIRIGSIARGLRYVPTNTGLRGRYETLGKNNRYILDVAHNPAGVRTLVAALHGKGLRDLVAVFGVMKDKDYISMIGELAKVVSVFVVVSPKMPRAVSTKVLSSSMKKMGLTAIRADSVFKGVKLALRVSGRGGKVLVTGSHYVVSEGLAGLLRNKA